MGLLDSMFGGGTRMELTLDTTTASPGSVVGGRIVLYGGQKPLRVTELGVRLLFVSTTTNPDSALPNIDAREVAKQIVAAGGDLPPGAQQAYTFRLTVPSDLPPTAHNVSFTVTAFADIPGVKDPSASADLRVVEASKDKGRRMPLEEVVSRFPNLHSRDEEQLSDALYEFFLACYSEGGELMEAEQLIAWHMANGTVKVRRKALQAWANLVDNRVRPEHLQTLYAIANMPGLDDETFEEVVIASTKFAEEGALQLVQQFAANPSAKVREQVASNLRFNAADKFNGKRELLVALAQDQSPEVRRAAIGALTSYNDDQQIAYWIANLTDTDPSPEVQAECISTLALVHYHGLGELSLAVSEKHAGNASPVVRKNVARNLSNQPAPAMQRVWGIAQRLAQDPDEDVRRALAFEFNNMQKMPQLLPIVQQMAQQDPSAEVRKDALGGMAALMQPAQVAQYFGHMMQQAQSEDDLWTVLNALRSHREHAPIKQLLTHLGQSQYPNVANAARETLSY